MHIRPARTGTAAPATVASVSAPEDITAPGWPGGAVQNIHAGLGASPHFLERPDGRLAYDDVGHGPLVVMVPGLGDLRAEYRYLAPRLVQAGYRVVALDLRGHGQSSTGWPDYTSAALGSDVVALVRHLGAGPAHLVGTSMGAAAVAWAAAEAKGCVRSLTLIGPFVRDVPPASAFKAAVQRVMMRIGFAGPWAPRAWGLAYASFHARKPADFDAYRDALVANLREPGRLDAVRGMILASKSDVEARLAEVQAPTLVIMGEADPDFADPRAEAETVARLLRGRVHMVPGAGHYPHVEAPDDVTPALRRFFGAQGNA